MTGELSLRFTTSFIFAFPLRVSVHLMHLVCVLNGTLQHIYDVICFYHMVNVSEMECQKHYAHTHMGLYRARSRLFAHYAVHISSYYRTTCVLPLLCHV